MSTRAVYTFKDERHTIHVYKHHDGYPEGGLSWIANARAYAWQLPRFEADEFAAAFVAANKPRITYPSDGGGVRLSTEAKPWDIAADAEYHYIVTAKNGKLAVTIEAVNWWDGYTKPNVLFSGSLETAIKKFKPQFLEAA